MKSILVITMSSRPDGSWTEPVPHTDTEPFIGKELIVAVRYPNNGTQHLAHFYGPIVRINELNGIVLNRMDGHGEFAIPPRAYLVEEHKRETNPTSMTTVIRPDYSTLIDLDGPPPEHGWNSAKDRHNE